MKKNQPIKNVKNVKPLPRGPTYLWLKLRSFMAAMINKTLEFKQKYFPRTMQKALPVRVRADASRSLSVVSQNPARKGVVRGLLWILILIVIGASGVSVYFYNRYRQATQDPQEIAQTESEKLLARVSKITLLPSGETPTIATISDPEKLKSQPFFNEAQTGDKVLIYTNARKAYIYRPSINRIISIAPLMTGDSSEFNTPASK